MMYNLYCERTGNIKGRFHYDLTTVIKGVANVVVYDVFPVVMSYILLKVLSGGKNEE